MYLGKFGFLRFISEIGGPCHLCDYSYINTPDDSSMKTQINLPKTRMMILLLMKWFVPLKLDVVGFEASFAFSRLANQAIFS